MAHPLGLSLTVSVSTVHKPPPWRLLPPRLPRSPPLAAATSHPTTWSPSNLHHGRVLSSPDFLRRRVPLIPQISTSPPPSRSGLFPFLGRFVAGVDRRRASLPAISTGLGFVGRASDPIRVLE